MQRKSFCNYKATIFFTLTLHRIKKALSLLILILVLSGCVDSGQEIEKDKDVVINTILDEYGLPQDEIDGDLHSFG